MRIKPFHAFMLIFTALNLFRTCTILIDRDINEKAFEKSKIVLEEKVYRLCFENKCNNPRKCIDNALIEYDSLFNTLTNTAGLTKLKSARQSGAIVLKNHEVRKNEQGGIEK